MAYELVWSLTLSIAYKFLATSLNAILRANDQHLIMAIIHIVVSSLGGKYIITVFHTNVGPFVLVRNQTVPSKPQMVETRKLWLSYWTKCTRRKKMREKLTPGNAYRNRETIKKLFAKGKVIGILAHRRFSVGVHWKNRVTNVLDS